MMSWDQYFFGIARAVAAKSKDRSVKIGAVISGRDHEVLSVGYNGFPRGIDDAPAWRHERPAKYPWTEHAERNAIYNAARAGTPLKGSTMHVQCPPCSPCARGIIQAGIARVVAEMGSEDFLPARSAIAWRVDIETAHEMLEEAGVEMSVSETWRAEPCQHEIWVGYCRGLGREIQKEFHVYIASDIFTLRRDEDSPCDNCGESQDKNGMLKFFSISGHQWLLCAYRPACRARRAKKEIAG